MRFLRLTLGPELISPSSAVTRGEVRNVQYLSDGTIMELYAVEGELDEILEELERSASTVRFEQLGTRAGTHYLFHHGRPSEEVRALIELLEAFHLMVVLPIVFDEERGATIDVVGESQSLQRVYDRFPAEIRRQTTVEQVGDYVPSRSGVLSVLTRRQREVLRAAVSVGYYAEPREGTAEDVAEAVGCAPSTASEHLRKLEARLFASLVDPETAID